MTEPSDPAAYEKPCEWLAEGDKDGRQVGKAWCPIHQHWEDEPVPAGWLDPPNPRHSCYDEQPKNLTREDWQRRWRCSCGKVYRVQDSQRDGFYFEAVKGD